MTRDAVPLHASDLSAFARRLRVELAQADKEADPPGHLRLLGQLARAGGYRSWQHLRASSRPVPSDLAQFVAPAPPAEPPVNEERVARALRAFDGEGRMARWPNRTAVQGLCLWALWARLPSRRDLSEAEVNDVLEAGSTFGDHVLLRRSLIDHGLASRTPDGRCYRRTEVRPPPEARALIAHTRRDLASAWATGVHAGDRSRPESHPPS